MGHTRPNQIKLDSDKLEDQSLSNGNPFTLDRDARRGVKLNEFFSSYN